MRAFGHPLALAAALAAAALADPRAAAAAEVEAYNFNASARYALVAPGAVAGAPSLYGGRVGLELGAQRARPSGLVWSLGGQLEYSPARYYDIPLHALRAGPVARVGGGERPWFAYALLGAHAGYINEEGDARFGFSITTGVGLVHLVGERLFFGFELAPRFEYVTAHPTVHTTVELRLPLGWRF